MNSVVDDSSEAEGSVMPLSQKSYSDIAEIDGLAFALQGNVSGFQGHAWFPQCTVKSLDDPTAHTWLAVLQNGISFDDV
jgi:hypothetical protein